VAPRGSVALRLSRRARLPTSAPVHRALAGLVALVGVLLAAPAPLDAAGTLRVGTYPNPPLIFRDEQGRPQGIYVDVLEHVARQERWTLEYVEGAWEQCLERLRRGEIDLLLAIGYSPERGRQFEFSHELLIENWGQVYAPRSANIHTLLDLTGRRLAVVRGDIYYAALQSTHQTLKVFPTFVEVSHYADALRLADQGQADAALVPRIFGAWAGRNSKAEKTSIMFSPVELRFAAPKGRGKEVLDALDRRLVALKADKGSVYHRSIRAWLEGVRTLNFPTWLNPFWVAGAVLGASGLAVGLNFLLGWLVRRRTRALRAEMAARAKIESELRIAREIQQSFVPRTYPPLPDWEIHGDLRPARQVGGDFYDCFLLEDGRLYFVLGDVSDKGVPAALFMAVTKTLLGASAVTGDSPAAIVDRVNRRTVLANDQCMFITAFCGILDPDTGHVVYTNAGHNPPLVLRAAGAVEVLEHGRAPALGITDDAHYAFYDMILGPGDALFMYTDGVTEATDRGGAFFTDERLRAVVGGHGGLSAEQLATAVLGQVSDFADGTPPADDIAVLVIRRVAGRLRLRSALTEIDRLAEEVGRVGREHALPEELVSDLRLVLEEAVTNVIRHGYRGREDGEIRVGFRVTPEAITATVEDDAPPFDPREWPDPPLPREGADAHGVGVYLIKRMMDEVDYRRRGSRNVLTLTKRTGRATCR
jgi:sigma-B regulation protein RsbU (phosphoserine phosphatase)